MAIYWCVGHLGGRFLRLHVVDQQKVNPETIMPGFYKKPQELNQVLDDYFGQTILSTQEVEDVVAYLMTLKE